MYNQKLCITHHSFLISVQKKCGFSNNFVGWIEIIMSKQESCIINGGNTTQYLHLERRAPQGNPISPYITILALEVLSFSVRNNNGIKGLNMFDHLFYTQFMQMIQRFILKTRNR